MCRLATKMSSPKNTPSLMDLFPSLRIYQSSDEEDEKSEDYDLDYIWAELSESPSLSEYEPPLKELDEDSEYDGSSVNPDQYTSTSCSEDDDDEYSDDQKNIDDDEPTITFGLYCKMYENYNNEESYDDDSPYEDDYGM